MKVRGISLLLGSVALLLCAQNVNASLLRTLKFDSEVEAPLKKQILGDLKFITSLKGKMVTPLHQEIFGGVDGKSYDSWFSKRVFSVGVDDCGSPTAVACVIVMYPNKMWITKNYTKFDHPQIARLSVIYHEARHTEEEHGNWSHATCPTPFRDSKGNDMKSIWTGALLEGKPACDETPFGSYGSQTILLKNIALHCENCNEKVKMDANFYGNDQFGRIIDQKARDAMRADLKISAPFRQRVSRQVEI